MKFLRFISCLFLWAAIFYPAIFWPATAQADTSATVRAAMEKATSYYRSLAVNGGYVWWYTPDRTQRWGERQAEPQEIWVSLYGTPYVGMVFIDAFHATQDRRYLEAAQEAADALAWGQLESGGWDNRIDFSPVGSTRWYRRLEVGQLTSEQIAARKNTTTLDDTSTPGALRFLIATLAASGDEQSDRVTRIRTALDYGLTALVREQYPNGSWPQVYYNAPRNDANFPVLAPSVPVNWPRIWPDEYFRSFYTLNDDVLVNCIDLLLDGAAKLGRADCLAAARRAGDFLILAQLPEPHPGWAQQYNFRMEPVWARRFEPPGVSSRESVTAINVLTRLYLVTGEQRYLAPAQTAAAWLRRSEIAPGRWARFYELHTNRPLFMDSNYQLTYLDADTPTHYSFQGNYSIPALLAHFERAKIVGPALLQNNGAPRKDEIEAGALRVAGRLDAQGRWVNNNRVQSIDFATNMRTLITYLKAQ